MTNAAATRTTIINRHNGRTMSFELLADFQTTRVTTHDGKSTEFGREYAAGRLHQFLRSGWTRVKAA
ncbi:MAG TPA: hypothetical protein VGK73_08885 [Polyangiaceae bacterium]